MIKTIRATSENADFRTLVSLLDQDLRIYDGDQHSFYDQYNKLDKINHAVVVYKNEIPVGCGALRAYTTDTVEIKRMFVKHEYRGQGISKIVLLELEKWAKELKFQTCILETGEIQKEAVSLYRNAGYALIPNYGPYVNVENSICMSKILVF